MSLLDLPNELLLLVVRNLETSDHRPKDLYNLLRVNHRLAYLLLPLFRKEVCNDKEGVLALKWAIVKNDLGLLQLLLKYGVDVNYAEKAYIMNCLKVDRATWVLALKHTSALQLAICRGRDEMTKLLLENGANDFTDLRGHTALHAAAYYGYSAIAHMLLDSGMDINVRNDKGFTVLHIAVMHGHLGLVGLFINRGVDLNALDMEGFTPLNRAFNTLLDIPTRPSKWYDIARLLLDAGGEVYDLETVYEVLTWIIEQPTPYYMHGTWDEMRGIVRREASLTATNFLEP